MLRIRKAVLLGLAFALSAIALAPVPTYACCTPCGSWCLSNPDAYCCTGISTPGDACGLTTCRKWLYGSRT